MKRSETLLCRLARRSPYCPHHFPTHRHAIFHRVLHCEILALLKLYLQIGTKEKRKRRGQIYRRERNTVFAQLSFVLSLIRQEFEQLPYRKRNSSWEHACPYVKMNDVYTSRNVRDGRTGRNIDSLLTLRTSRIEILSNRVGREYLHRRCTVRYKQIFSSLCNNHCYYLNFESKRTVL